jgi:phage/plasmid-associated DNA primase
MSQVFAPEYCDLTSTFRTDNEESYTHSARYPNLYLQIGRPSRGDFWFRYCSLIDQEEPGCVGISERISDITPVFIYAELVLQDEKCTDENSADGYPVPQRFFLEMIAAMHRVIEDVMQVKDTNQAFYTALLTPRDDEYIVEQDTIHYPFAIFLPWCKVERGVLKRTLFPRFMREFTRKHIMEMLQLQPVSSLTDTVSQHVYDNDLPMYGSVWSESKIALALDICVPSLVDTKISESPDDRSIIVIDIERFFDPAQHSDVIEGNMGTETIEQEEVSFWLPLLFSQHYCRKLIHPKEDYRSHAPAENDIQGARFTDDISMARSLLPLISSRHSGFNNLDVLSIGKALYNIFGGSREGFRAWSEWLEGKGGNSGMDEDALWDIYQGLNESNYYSIKTIAWFAQLDSPGAYTDWCNEWCYDIIKNARVISEQLVGEILYTTMWLRYINIDGTRNGWYEFYKTYWRPVKFVRIRSELRNKLGPYLSHLRTEISRDIEQNHHNYGAGRSMENILTTINAIIDKIQKTSFKENVMRECNDKFFDYRFDEMRDNNPNLMALSNKTIEVVEGDDGESIHIREGQPEDYCTLHSGAEWRDDYTWDSRDVVTFMDWVNKLHPDEEDRDYFLTYHAYCIKSGNPERKVPVMYGPTHGGKSSWKRCITAAFGDYAKTAPSNFLTSRRRQTEGATPILLSYKHAKIVYSQETSKNDMFNSGFVKESSGGDDVSVRGLYKAPENMQIMFKIIHICNTPPKIDDPLDTALRERLVLIHCKTRWSYKAPESSAEQKRKRHYQKDSRFERTITRLASACLWVLVQYYDNYVDGSLERLPPNIKQATRRYFHDNNAYRQYIESKIEFVDDENVVLDPDSLYQDFRIWLSITNNINKNHIPSQFDAIKAFSQEFNAIPQAEGWLGVRIKPQLARPTNNEFDDM